MKQSFFTTVAMLLCMSLPMHAANGQHQYLIFETSESTTALAMESLKLTISDGVLTATNSDDSRSFWLKDITRIYLSEDDATKIVYVKNSTEQTADGALLDIQGRRIQHPSHGIYIVKNQGKTQKVIVK